MVSFTTRRSRPSSSAAWRSVRSSDVAAIRYHPKQRQLEVKFIKTGPYRFYSVSPSTARDFGNAGSKGRFFARVIKGQYSYSKG